jgi:hypothetical protein
LAGFRFSSCFSQLLKAFDELEHKKAKLARASKRIIECYESQDGLSDDEVNHDLKQKARLII